MLDASLLTLVEQPLLLAIALFGATFVAEDVVTIAAGLLVARTGADPIAALAAVILGTATGDIALYAFGRWGAETRLGRRLCTRSDVVRAERWIAGRLLALVFAARFLPGFRLPVFTASGLVATPFVPFAVIIAFSTPIWTGALFTAARFAGETGAAQFVATAVPFGLLMGLVILLLNRKRALLFA